MAKHRTKQKKIIVDGPKSTLTKKTISRIEDYDYPSWWLDKWWIFGIIMLSMGLYALTYQYGYILDDKIVITDNQFVQNGISSWWDILSKESMAGFFGEQMNLVEGARYRPLSLITFALEKSLFGTSPGLSHWVNALLYGLTGAFIFYLARLFFYEKTNRLWYMDIAFWSALLFIVHPVHSEVVANIKGRDEIMALLFSLSALIVAFKADKLSQYLVSGLLLYLGLLSKENALTFVAVIPVAIYFFHPRYRTTKEWMQLVGVLVLVSALYLLQRYAVIGYLLNSGQQITELLNDPFVQMSSSQKFATIFFTFIKYLQLLVWPYPLSHDYYPYAIPIMNWDNIWVMLSVLLHVAATVFILIKWRSKSPYIAFLLIYFATLSIVSNLLFTVGTTMNERFIYMPSIAFVWFIGYLFFHKNNVPVWRRRIRILFISCVSLLFALLTFKRLPDWNDYIRLNKSAIDAYPNSARSNMFYGTALYQKAMDIPDIEEKKALFNEAAAHIQKSVEIYPVYGNGQKMKTGVAAQQFQIDRNVSKLLQTFSEVAHDRPSTKYLHEYLEYLNNRGEFTSALIDFYYKVGYQDLVLQQGRLDWGLKFLDYGMMIDPTDKRIRSAVADTYRRAGQIDKARQFE